MQKRKFTPSGIKKENHANVIKLAQKSRDIVELPGWVDRIRKVSKGSKNHIYQKANILGTGSPVPTRGKNQTYH